MNLRSAWLVETGQTRADTRVAPLGVFTPTSPVAVRSGVLPGSAGGQTRLSGLTLTGTAAMTASISPGRAVIQGSDAQGAYPVALTEYLDLTFQDGDAQFDRLDLVVLRIYDDLYDDSGRTEAVVEILKGVAASAPVAPAAPPLSLPLYQVRVDAGASAGTHGITWSDALTGLRTATVGLGGILPVTTDTAPGAYPGQYRDINGRLERWDATAGWQRYPAVPAWQSWTPTWTTSTGVGTPSFGNATLSCRYIQNGPVVHLKLEIVFNTTTKFGTGTGQDDNWRFTLPVPAVNTPQVIGFAELNASTTARAVARMRCTSNAFFELELAATLSMVTDPKIGIADAVSPWTWASGDAIRGVATYEAAAV